MFNKQAFIFLLYTYIYLLLTCSNINIHYCIPGEHFPSVPETTYIYIYAVICVHVYIYICSYMNTYIFIDLYIPIYMNMN